MTVKELQNLRNDLDMNQTQFAAAMGWYLKTLVDIEMGRLTLSPCDVQQIRDKFPEQFSNRKMAGAANR